MFLLNADQDLQLERLNPKCRDWEGGQPYEEECIVCDTEVRSQASTRHIFYHCLHPKLLRLPLEARNQYTAQAGCQLGDLSASTF